MKTTFNKVYTRALSLCLSAALTFSVTGCGKSLVNESAPEPVHQETVSINDVINITTGKVKTREKQTVDYSDERFQVEGNNAFYILPGLENIPDAMAAFDVLDYNSRGEFVYYYVTPCYITPDELERYNTSSAATGRVKDKSTVSVPEGRRNDYEYDAEVMMTYNPDTGYYRVMYAKAYEIDKENEFDPETEGRPYYYRFLSDDTEDSYDAFIMERAYACKVAGREEYLLLDQAGFTGRVFDRMGNIVSSMTYKPTLTNEANEKRDELEKLRDDRNRESLIDSSEMDKLNAWREENRRFSGSGRNKDNGRMNAIVTGIAMTEAYQTYLGITFFLGDELFDTETVQLSTTYMIYRQALNEEDGGTPFVSVNTNSDKQAEQWMSLDDKFFTSREEFEDTVGYSMVDMKTGAEGDEYKDQFTPFIAGSGEGDASVLVELPDYRTMPGKWIDRSSAKALIRSYKDLQGWEREYLESYVEYEGGITWSADVEQNVYDEMFIYQKYMTERGKKILQNIIADSILRGLGNDDDLAGYIEKLGERGWIPYPGEFTEDGGRGYNKVPDGFYQSGIVDDTFKVALSRVSDHTLSVVSRNGVYKRHIAPVDYFPDREDAARRTIGELRDTDDLRGVTMEPYKMSEELSRTTYIYEPDKADIQIKEIIEHESLSESAKDAIEEITALLRTSADTLEKLKMGWFLNELINNDMDEVLDDILDEAEEAYDDDKISEKEYDRILDLYDDLYDDMEERDPEEVFETIRDDLEEKHDKKEISDKEYKEISKILDKAEEDEMDLSEEELEILEKLIRGSRIISDVHDASEAAKDADRQEMLEEVDRLSKEIPEDLREGMLYLCAGFSINVETTEEYPTSYKVVFPEGAAVTVKENGQAETVGGKMDSFRDGVLVAAESNGKLYNGNSFLIGYKGVGDMDLFSPYSYGKPMDVTSLEYYDGKEVRTIVVLMTDKGLRFFEKGEEITDYGVYLLSELEEMLGKDNADIVYEIYELEDSMGIAKTELPPGAFLPDDVAGKGLPEEAGASFPGASVGMNNDLNVDYKQRSGIHNVYSPLQIGDRGKEAYKAAKDEGGLPKAVKEGDFTGFMTNRMLLTSTGYTRDTENRLTEAIEEELNKISESENAVNNSKAENATDKSAIDEDLSLDTSNMTIDYNERYRGHLNSAKNISMISRDKALICSMGEGTKILDLNYGTVADDMTGSYYRAFQKGNSTTYKLLGFEDNDYTYLDNDIPRCKVYTLEYSTLELNRSVIDSFLKMLKQYAEDYLFREYRTVLNENEEVVTKEKTEEEKEESKEAGKIFDPANKSYEQALHELEKKYGIERSPKEVRDYVNSIRERIAAVRPAIAKIYELAGARKLASDTAKRSEGYYKNLESRMTMAIDKDSMCDILVEIRMLDDVMAGLDSEQARKYRSYKTVLDYEKEHGKASAEDIFREGEAERTPEEIENDRLKNEYRQDVLNDIINEYAASKNKGRAGDEEKEPGIMEKSEMFNTYLESLIDKVNPENFTKENDKTADEFIGIINHGKEILSGVRLEEMTARLKDELPGIDAVWKLEEMIIKEKTEHESSYSSYKDWLRDYNDRIELAESEETTGKVPVTTGDDESRTKKTPLSGKERISYLRTSPAYKAIIGDLKADTVVKEFLTERKETWDDYCKYVIKKAGAGAVMNDSGFVEGSGIEEGMKDLQKDQTGSK